MPERTLEAELQDAETWACCTWPERAIRAEHQLAAAEKELESVKAAREWYKERMDAMQRWQHTLPAPFRTECCDILANGKIAPWRNKDGQHEG